MPWWILALGVAHAEPYLETAPFASREAAAQARSLLADGGCEGSIIRRYVQAEGWRFLVRVPATEACADALTSLASGAVVASRRSAAREDDDAAVADDDGSGVDDADEGGAEGPGGSEADLAEDPTDPAPSRPEEEDTSDILVDIPAPRRAPTADTPAITAAEAFARLLRAHRGVRPTGIPDPLVFRFERSTPDGRRVAHTYARRGEDRYLAVDVVEGPGTSSRAGVAGECPWFDGALSHPLEPDAVRDTLDRFAPEQVLGLAMSLWGEDPEIPDPAVVSVAPVAAGDAPDRLVLRVEGDRNTPPSRWEIDRSTWRLVAVTRGVAGGEVTRAYDAWQASGDGPLHPARVVVRRGARVLDALVVQELDPAPTLPAEWFPPCPP